MTITIILVDLVSLEAAILGGGIVLSLRRVGEAVFAPIGGWLGDRLGTESGDLRRDGVDPGGPRRHRARAGSTPARERSLSDGRRSRRSAPATVAVRSPPEHLMHRMATMQTWRDFGAALGPLLSGFLLARLRDFRDLSRARPHPGRRTSRARFPPRLSRRHRTPATRRRRRRVERRLHLRRGDATVPA